MSVLYTGIIFHVFMFSFFFWQFLFVCIFLKQFSGWLQHFFIHISSWECGGRGFKKVVLVTLWKNLCCSTSNIFFTLLPGQAWLGQKLMLQKKYLKITKFVGIYLLKTDVKSSSKHIWLFILTFELTSKLAREKG